MERLQLRGRRLILTSFEARTRAGDASVDDRASGGPSRSGGRSNAKTAYRPADRQGSRGVPEPSGLGVPELRAEILVVEGGGGVREHPAQFEQAGFEVGVLLAVVEFRPALLRLQSGLLRGQ